MYGMRKHCRWCGIEYIATKPPDRNGFHTPACKQAHYRAYKAYVTAQDQKKARAQGKPITRKKRKNK